MSRANNLLEIWNLYSNQVIAEKAPVKRSQKFGTKQGPGPIGLNDKKAGDISQKDLTGPVGVDNFDGPAFNRSISDLKTMSEKDKAEKPYVAKLNVAVEKFDKDMEKSTKTIINNNMKSTFDKLFEEVMKSEDAQDLAALGVDAQADDLGLEAEGEVDGDVTITLTPDHVQLLKDILSQVEGDVEGDVDELGDETTSDDDMGGEEDAEETDKDEMHQEGTDMEEVPDSKGLALQKKDNKVHDVTSKHDVGAGEAGTKKIEDGVDGKGKDVPDSAGLGLTKISNNKPKSKIKGGNQLAFGVK
jgi:hypothetical protein